MINGRACSGKDFLADYLVEKYDYVKLSFATPIYEIAYNLFYMKSKDRDLLQKIGQKMREIDPDVFVKWTLNDINKFKKVVIADCRQKNEYEFCKNKGFTTIRISSDLEVRIQRAIKRDSTYPDIQAWENESETGADNFKYDFEVKNNGAPEYIYGICDNIISGRQQRLQIITDNLE